MAYNRSFNPDALPAFAEPERRNGSGPSAPTPAPASAPTPVQQAARPQQQQQVARPQQQQYNSGPPPPQKNGPPQQYGGNNAQPPPNQIPPAGYSQSYNSGPPPPQKNGPSQQYGGNNAQPPPNQIPPAGYSQSYNNNNNQPYNNSGNQSYNNNNNNNRPQPGGQRLSPQIQPPANYGYSSSPPIQQGQGFQAPQTRPASTQSRPASTQSRPVSNPNPGAADPALWPLFKAVDKSGSGQLTEQELGAALVNGDWTSFDLHTVRMMIRMFDSDRSGSIGFDEFCGLWGFLASWRALFDRFDVDRSGNISLDEYTNALVAFGYRLTPQFVRTLFKTYDKRNENAMSFDLFVQSCISLKRMTDVFKKYDDDRDGFITLSFEDFLLEILKQR